MSSKRLESNHALNKKGKTDAQPFMTFFVISVQAFLTRDKSCKDI